MASYSKYLLIGLPVLTLAGIAALCWSRRERQVTYNEVGRVTELFTYPVKSCKGIAVDEIKCYKEGMEFDRRWVILDEKDAFVHMRIYPKLALVTPHFEDDRYLCLDAPGVTTLKMDKQPGGTEFKRIKIFGTYGEGQYVGDEASEWFSNYLNKPGCRLYKLSKPRLVIESKDGADCARPDDKVSFGDLGPYFIANEASLAAVNKELQSPVTMKRFRPNIVITGGLKAFEEYEWESKRIKIGQMEFRFLTICERCSMTTVNPETGEKKGDEPLATLKRMRLTDNRAPKHGKSPLFGVYVVPVRDGVGVLRVGDSVMVEQ